MPRFEDKTILITGGTRGIGRACAELFHAEGGRVALCGRDAGTAERVAGEIGGDTRGYGCDVTDAAAVDRMVQQAGKDLGEIAILVNNAGITRDGLLMRMKDADWDAVLATSLNAAFYTCRAAARGMLKQRYGRIVNISSILGLRGQGGQTNYCAAKAALFGFTKAYAQEVASRNITVNAVAPGLTETDMTAGMDPALWKTAIERIPLQRAATPRDIADAVAFLASDEAAYITGAILQVDGGLGM